MKLFYATALAGLMALPVQAQETPCGNLLGMLEVVTGDYGEVEQWVGSMANGIILRMFANPDTGTWTMLTHQPGIPVACAPASGEGYSFTVLSEPS